MPCPRGYATKATKAYVKFSDHLDAAFVMELPRRGLFLPRTKLSSPLHSKPEDRRLAGKSLRLQGTGTPRLQR
jgi:hypothetical protein